MASLDALLALHIHSAATNGGIGRKKLLLGTSSNRDAPIIESSTRADQMALFHGLVCGLAQNKPTDDTWKRLIERYASVSNTAVLRRSLARAVELCCNDPKACWEILGRIRGAVALEIARSLPGGSIILDTMVSKSSRSVELEVREATAWLLRDGGSKIEGYGKILGRLAVGSEIGVRIACAEAIERLGREGVEVEELGKIAFSLLGCRTELVRSKIAVALGVLVGCGVRDTGKTWGKKKEFDGTPLEVWTGVGERIADVFPQGEVQYRARKAFGIAIASFWNCQQIEAIVNDELVGLDVFMSCFRGMYNSKTIIDALWSGVLSRVKLWAYPLYIERLLRICVEVSNSNIIIAAASSAARLISAMEDDAVDSLNFDPSLYIGVLGNGDGEVRRAFAYVFRSIVVSLPHRATEILDHLHVECGPHISAASVPNSNTSTSNQTLATLHGLVLSVSILLRSTTERGIPSQLFEEIFATASILLSIASESRDKLDLSLRAAQALFEYGWTLVDALFVNNVEWFSDRGNALIQSWKYTLGVVVTPDEENAHELLATLHSRAISITALRTYILGVKGSLTHEIAIPLRGFLSNSLNYANILRKSSLWKSLLESDSSVEHQLLILETCILDLYDYFPGSSKITSSLQMAVSRIISPRCRKTSLLNTSVDPDFLLVLFHEFPEVIANLATNTTVGFKYIEQFNSAKSETELVSVNAAVAFFARSFVNQSNIHRKQLLSHFVDITKQITGARGDYAVAMYNIGASILLTLRQISQNGMFFTISELDSPSPIQDANANLLGMLIDICKALVSTEDLSVRLVGAQCLGLLCKIEGEDLANALLQTYEKDIIQSDFSKTSYCLVFCSVFFQLGSISASRYLPSILGTLESFSLLPELKEWVLYSIWAIISAAGMSLASYFDRALSLIMKLVSVDVSFSVWTSLTGFHLARVIHSIFENFGPELVGNIDRLKNVLSLWQVLESPCIAYTNTTQVQISLYRLKCLHELILWNSSSDTIEYHSVEQCIFDQLDSLRFNDELLLAWNSILLLCIQKDDTIISRRELPILILTLIDESTSSAVAIALYHTIESIIECNSSSVVIFTLLLDVATKKSIPCEMFSSVMQSNIEDEDDEQELLLISNSTLELVYQAIILTVPLIGKLSGHEQYDLAGYCVKTFCRACNLPSDPLKLAGISGIRLLPKSFKDVTDPRDKSQTIFEHFQQEITSSLRSILSSSSSSPATRKAVCEILPGLLSEGLITNDYCTRRLTSSLVKPLDTGVHCIAGWESLYSSTTRVSVLLSHITSLSQIALSHPGLLEEWIPKLIDMQHSVLKDSVSLSSRPSPGCLYEHGCNFECKLAYFKAIGPVLLSYATLSNDFCLVYAVSVFTLKSLLGLEGIVDSRLTNYLGTASAGCVRAIANSLTSESQCQESLLLLDAIVNVPSLYDSCFSEIPCLLLALLNYPGNLPSLTVYTLLGRVIGDAVKGTHSYVIETLCMALTESCSPSPAIDVMLTHVLISSLEKVPTSAAINCLQHLATTSPSNELKEYIVFNLIEISSSSYSAVNLTLVFDSLYELAEEPHWQTIAAKVRVSMLCENIEKRCSALTFFNNLLHCVLSDHDNDFKSKFFLSALFPAVFAVSRAPLSSVDAIISFEALAVFTVVCEQTPDRRTCFLLVIDLLLRQLDSSPKIVEAAVQNLARLARLGECFKECFCQMDPSYQKKFQEALQGQASSGKPKKKSLKKKKKRAV